MMNYKGPILKSKNKILSLNDFSVALEQLGIRKGDTVCVHSQLFSLGSPLVAKDELLGGIISALQEIVGKHGTLIMPVFSYSFCKNEIYDIENSPSDVGILTEHFRKRRDTFRTEHPIFSFSIWGDERKVYRNFGVDAFSQDSVYGKMIQENGKIIMLGANKGYTFYYLAEEHENVSHRYFKNFEGQIKYLDGIIKKATIPYFVRDLSVKSELDEQKLADFLLEKGLQKQIEFGNGTIGVFDCRKVYNVLVTELIEDEKRFL